jgi:membrane protease subunit HflK
MPERKVSAFGFDFSPKLVILLIVLAVIAYGAFQSIYIVDQTEEAVVLTFGKYSRTEGPGMQFKIPLIEENYNVATKIVQKMDFGFRMDGQGGDIFAQDSTKTSFKDESTMLTGDLNIVDITWIIQYRITDPKAWLFNLESKEKTIRDISQSMVSQLVGDRAILDVLGNERQSIEAKATELINERFAAYGIGVLVTGTQLKDIFPPEGNVRAAFDDVNVAFQDMNKLINQGRETYNKKIPEAAGEAQQQIQVAEGYATERVNKATGDVARFKAVLAEYRRSPEVTRNRLYLETVESVFKAQEGTDLIDKKLGSFLPMKTLGPKAAAAVVPTADSPATPAAGGN